MTGSGILVSELWQCALDYGDEQQILAAGYADDDFSRLFQRNYSLIKYSLDHQQGQLPFPILGMSDVMPYPSRRYSDAGFSEIDAHLNAYRSAMEELILSFKPDVIHIHHLWILVALSNYSPRVPCFVTIHGTDLKQLKTAPQFRKYVEKGIDNISHFFSVSRDIMGDACSAYGISQKRVSIIGNGYNEKVFRLDGPATKDKDKLILAAGKFVGWKGFRFLIRACCRLKTPYRLIIAGTGREENRKELIDEAVRNNVQERLSLPGHLSQLELAALMRGADVFVLPSIYEPFGLVFLEAMACGSPVIAADCGGAKDVIRKTDMISPGWATLIPPLKEGDQIDEERYVADLQQAIEKHLAQSPTDHTRINISNSVKGLEWGGIYQAIRAEYLKSCGWI